MCDSMIDRVARAISVTCLRGCEDQGDINSCREDLCECRRAARTAIEAMREPLITMKLRGGRTLLAKPLGPLRSSSYSAASEIWRAMIDAALKEPAR